jgi:cytoskeletal protein CcmA (bactofilin family)
MFIFLSCSEYRPAIGDFENLNIAGAYLSTLGEVKIHTSFKFSTASGHAATSGVSMTINPVQTTGIPPVTSKVAACVSQGIKIKGELTGSEDLFIDGQIEGSITLTNSVVTVGPNAKVKAEINAREVVVRGRVDGKVTGTEKIQVWNTARINGDMKSERIAVEEGAELHGTLEVGKVSDRFADMSKGASAKKAENVKTNSASSSEEKPSSGAAVAGAD